MAYSSPPPLNGRIAAKQRCRLDTGAGSRFPVLGSRQGRTPPRAADETRRLSRSDCREPMSMPTTSQRSERPSADCADKPRRLGNRYRTFAIRGGRTPKVGARRAGRGRAGVAPLRSSRPSLKIGHRHGAYFTGWRRSDQIARWKRMASAAHLHCCAKLSAALPGSVLWRKEDQIMYRDVAPVVKHPGSGHPEGVSIRQVVRETGISPRLSARCSTILTHSRIGRETADIRSSALIQAPSADNPGNATLPPSAVSLSRPSTSSSEILKVFAGAMAQ